MKIDDILLIMQNKLISLTENRKAAVNNGDLITVTNIDLQINETEKTIEQLKQALTITINN